MTAVGVQNSNQSGAEYLQLLHSLASELDRAMNAIAHNCLADLEESVLNQQVLSARLSALVDGMCVTLESSPSESSPAVDAGIAKQIQSASEKLQTLNLRYATLLRHSSRSLALMASLFSSFTGQLQEASGPRSRLQTWSCQM
jgi:hypothetical protein